MPPKSVRRLTAPQASCLNPAMRLNVSLPSSLYGLHWRPRLSSQHERFSFGDPLFVQAWLAMPYGSWPTAARRQEGVALHGTHLAFFTSKTDGGDPRAKAGGKFVFVVPFPWPVAPFEARGWLLKYNCAPCDSGSARGNASLIAPELGPHLPHIPDHGLSGRRGALRSMPGRGDGVTADLLHRRTCDSDA